MPPPPHVTWCRPRPRICRRPSPPLCRVQPGASCEQQCCGHLHGFVLREYSATHGLQGPQSFQRERCSPSPLSFWPFSVSLQAFFSIKYIRDSHLVARGTAQRPFRTGQDRGVCSPFILGAWERLVVSQCYLSPELVTCVAVFDVILISWHWFPAPWECMPGLLGRKSHQNQNGGLFLSGPRTPGDSARVLAFVFEGPSAHEDLCWGLGSRRFTGSEGDDPQTISLEEATMRPQRHPPAKPTGHTHSLPAKQSQPKKGGLSQTPACQYVGTVPLSWPCRATGW